MKSIASKLRGRGRGLTPRGRAPAASDLSDLLDSPEIAALIAELDELHWIGRKGYGARMLVGACVVRSLYALPT